MTGPRPGPRPYRIRWKEVVCQVCGAVKRYSGDDYKNAPKFSCRLATCKSEISSRTTRARANAGLRSDARAIAHATSPLSARGPTHWKGRWWSLQSPEGRVYRFRNLNDWLRSNTELFDPNDVRERPQAKSGVRTRAGASLRKLRPGLQMTPKRSWKGWTWAPCESDDLDQAIADLRPGPE